LARTFSRSAWWGFLVLPVVLEFNLSYGFVAYCLAGVFFVLGLAFVVRSEGDAGKGNLVWAGVLALALGWTHPYVGAAFILSVMVVQVLGSGPVRSRVLTTCVASISLLPTLLWFVVAGDDNQSLAGGPEFASPGELLRMLPMFSIDVFPERVEEVVYGLALFVVVLAWLRTGRGVRLRHLRPHVVAFVFFLLYFVTPWDLNGQAVCQRMPYFVLLLVPAMAPVGSAPDGITRAALLTLACVGALNTGIHVIGFSRETEQSMGAILQDPPRRARLVYIAYDVTSPWVNAPVHLHSGARVTGPIRWAWSSFTVESSPRHEKRRAPRPWRGHPRPGLN
jgi:hypothetical protein